MPDDLQLASIAHVIQLSVAPVFLLSGIAALLNVLTNRLSRIVDRARKMEEQFSGVAPGRAEQLRTSLRRLATRARWVGWGISLCASSAILISSVVIVLFIETVAGVSGRFIVAGLFILAMLALTAGLVCFLREINLATRYLRIGEPDPDPPVDTVVGTRPSSST